MSVCRMRLRVAFVFVVVTMLIPSPAHSQSSTADELVWHWFGACRDARTMTVDVRLSSKRLFTSSFPICFIHRSEKQDHGAHDNLRFFFKAPARIFGEEFASLGTPEIEGNIWEAGSEHDVILLGVSFMTKDRILLNTIHIAPATNAVQAELAEHLVMKSVVQPSVQKK
jgi:hypothetical protein